MFSNKKIYTKDELWKFYYTSYTIDYVCIYIYILFYGQKS